MSKPPTADTPPLRHHQLHKPKPLQRSTTMTTLPDYDALDFESRDEIDAQDEEAFARLLMFGEEF